MSEEAKRTIRLKPVTPPGTETTPPQPEIPGVKQTIKLRPSGLTPPPLAPTLPAMGNEAKRTIKLTPPPMTAPSPVPNTASGRIPPVMGATASGRIPPAISAVPTSTGRIPAVSGHVPTSTGKVPVMRGPVPTVIPTGVPPPPEGVNTASGRIAHVAVAPSQLMETATAVVPKVSTPPPMVSATPETTPGAKTLTLAQNNLAAKSTIKLAAPGASNTTLKLSRPGAPSAAPGAATINLSTPAPAAENASPAKKTLSLKKAGTVAEEHETLAKKLDENGIKLDEDDGVGFHGGGYQHFPKIKDESTGGMPHIIVASLAFAGIAFLAYAIIAQFSNFSWDENSPKKPEKDYLSIPSFPDYNEAFKGNVDRN